MNRAHYRLSSLLQQVSPTTRREILKLAAAGGLAAPASLAMLAVALLTDRRSG